MFPGVHLSLTYLHGLFQFVFSSRKIELPSDYSPWLSLASAVEVEVHISGRQLLSRKSPEHLLKACHMSPICCPLKANCNLCGTQFSRVRSSFRQSLAYQPLALAWSGSSGYGKVWLFAPVYVFVGSALPGRVTCPFFFFAEASWPKQPFCKYFG